MREWMKVYKLRMLGLLLAAAALGAPQPGRTAPVAFEPGVPFTVFETSAFIGGTAAQTTQAQFFIPAAGTVKVKLADMAFPQALSSLSFWLTDSHQVFANLSAPGEFTFELDAPGAFFGFISGAAQGALNLGQYYAQVSLTPSAVPLPAAGLFLFSGLAGLLALRRRRAGVQS